MRATRTSEIGNSNGISEQTSAAEAANPLKHLADHTIADKSITVRTLLRDSSMGIVVLEHGLQDVKSIFHCRLLYLLSLKPPGKRPAAEYCSL